MEKNYLLKKYMREAAELERAETLDLNKTCTRNDSQKDQACEFITVTFNFVRNLIGKGE